MTGEKARLGGVIETFVGLAWTASAVNHVATPNAETSICVLVPIRAYLAKDGQVLRATTLTVKGSHWMAAG